jgi:hypothetical protein
MDDEQQHRLKAQAAGQPAWGTIANAQTMQRYTKLLPGRYRNRRKCPWGCGGKQSHGGYVNGLAMTGGCEWSMRRWVKFGYEGTSCAPNRSIIGNHDRRI